jgi:endonuclease YncB( thermonuclease family)
LLRCRRCCRSAASTGPATRRHGLTELIAAGEASCTLTADKPDSFNRRFGVCTSDGKDIGAELVRLGYALAYAEQAPDYLPQEQEAKEAKAAKAASGRTAPR